MSLLSFLDATGQPENFVVALPYGEGDLYEELTRRNIGTERFSMPRFSKARNFLWKMGYLFHWLRTSVKLARLVKREKIDLLYANANQSLPYALGAKLFTGKKIVWHVRDTVSNRLLAKILSAFVHKIICISDFIAGQFPEMKNRKYVVYNGIDTALWSPSAKAGFLQKELGLPADTLLVAQAGQLLPWKNHHDFIRLTALIAPEFPNVHFLIIGADLFGNNEAYVNELKTLIEEHKLTARISFLGYRKNIKDCMNELDMLVHLALNEPFGRVLIEAMALEKPVVAYASGGVKEIVQDNRTGFLIPPENYTEAAAKVMMLLENEQLSRSLGLQGRKEAEARFSAKETAARMEEVLR